MAKKEDYSHVHDEETDRTRVELWIIVAIVVVVVVGAIGWRLIARKPTSPAQTPPSNTAASGLPAAGAGVRPPSPPPATPQ
jgi:hypothetical protein